MDGSVARAATPAKEIVPGRVTVSTPTTPTAGGNGSFVIGDLDAVVGHKVYFWGSQWAQNNHLSKGAAPSAFKGFANSVGGSTPNCGVTWKSDPGDSSESPNNVPALITVIASSSVTKSGSVITGDTKQIAVVRTEPDYSRSPGHSGIGTVISVTTCEHATNPLDEFVPEGALTLIGASPGSFNSRTAPLTFGLSSAEFDTEHVKDIRLIINGTDVGPSFITVEAHVLTALVTLANGRNDISLKAYDTVGRPLYFKGILWAGSANLQVNLVNPNGSSFLQSAKVVAVLSDDENVTAESTTTTGGVVFQNLPTRTILIKAQGSANETGIAGVIGSQGIVNIQMTGFAIPNPIENNDFSLGSAGWDIGSAPVSIVPHLEIIPGFSQEGGAVNANAKALAAVQTATDANQDLVLGTAGEGEQFISRTFTTHQGTSSIRVRYRFITSEVPGGYFGSMYNDYFRVSIRSKKGGGFAGEANSMNGLGLGAFHFASGSTNWREKTLPVAPDGDTIQVDVGVANVGDGILDSQVVVDFVQEVHDEVQPHLAWNNITGGLDVTYEIHDNPTTQNAMVDVYWANGQGYTNRVGDAFFSQSVPAGTLPGAYGPFHIGGANLANNPDGATYIIGTTSPTQVSPLADVKVGYGANADVAQVSAGILDLTKDGLRNAGQATATITSTARTPADQARAMFNNLVSAAHTIAENVQIQLGIYGPPGDAVINVFVAQTSDMTRLEILEHSVAIQAAMEKEINNQGPSKVSHHCADPELVSVVDVFATPFNTSNGPLFVSFVTLRLTRFIDERATNHCYHMELNR